MIEKAVLSFPRNNRTIMATMMPVKIISFQVELMDAVIGPVVSLE